MKIVVDTSVIVAVIAIEPERTALVELARGSELIAPHSVHWEIGNAFSAMLKRKRITREEASKAFGGLRQDSDKVSGYRIGAVFEDCG